MVWKIFKQVWWLHLVRVRVFSGVSGMGGSNALGNAVTTGFFFALVQGGLYQVGKKFAKTPTEDNDYLRGKSMLQKLELQKYEKNFRKGLLTSSTLHLVNDMFVSARDLDTSFFQDRRTTYRKAGV